MSDSEETLLQHLDMLMPMLQKAQLCTYIFIVAHKLNLSLSDVSQSLEFRFAETFVHLREPDEVFRHLGATKLEWSRRRSNRYDHSVELWYVSQHTFTLRDEKKKLVGV
jgi:hypothetical protein